MMPYTLPFHANSLLHSCIEHYFALIAACMPTLGPFFKWLRPNHWKHVAIGPKSLRYDGDPERVWPHPNKTTSDDTLLERATEGKFACEEREMTPREMDRAWMKGRKGKGNGEGIELQEREVERG